MFKSGLIVIARSVSDAAISLTDQLDGASPREIATLHVVSLAMTRPGRAENKKLKEKGVSFNNFTVKCDKKGRFHPYFSCL